jgi:hypothetical protein
MDITIISAGRPIKVPMHEVTKILAGHNGRLEVYLEEGFLSGDEVVFPNFSSESE